MPIFSFKSEGVRFIFVFMQRPDVLMQVIEKLDEQIAGNTQWRQSWVKTQKSKYPDLSALKPELSAQESVLAPAIDAVCWTWIQTGKLPPGIGTVDAKTLGPFVWDRFSRGLLFAKYLYDGGCRIYGKSEHEVLIWLLVDSWKFFGRMAWKQTPAESL
jgi:hypothetical protein